MVASGIFTGHVLHARQEPIPHRFVYPLYYFALDLAELPALDKTVPLFGLNRWRLTAIHECDYLGGGTDSMPARVQRLLAPYVPEVASQRIVLLTCPRYCHYVFNPISFFLCYRADNTLGSAVAEINNTYGETHFYVLPHWQASPSGYQAHTAKAFFVSPFNDMKGDYTFHITMLPERLDIHVALQRQGKQVLYARLWGQGVPFTNANLARTLLRYPLSAALTVPRTIWQAWQLRRRGLQPRLKPHPSSPLTIRARRAAFLGSLWNARRTNR